MVLKRMEEEPLEDEVVYETEVPILTISPSEKESKSFFRDLLEMRNEASFCDVAFLVQGTLFRAHRVVVSAWSRWLFAMLSEGPDQEMVSLDVFSPNEFGAVLDYMYGVPLEFTLANAENIIKILRRLEMMTLEQKCWRFLLSIVDGENCVKLHQIADFYECAPLKISAWRIIQESKPGYTAAPTHMINSMQVNANNSRIRGHGLTGPGEIDKLSSRNQEQDDESEVEEADFSIFTATTPTFGDNSSAPDEGLLGSVNKRYDHYIHPEKLPKGTPATEVIKAWSFRLQEVFADCCADSDMTMAEHAGMSAAAFNNNKSDTESVHQDDESVSIQRQQSNASIQSRPSVYSSATAQSVPKISQSSSHHPTMQSRRSPHDSKGLSSVKFSEIPELEEKSDCTDNATNDKEDVSEQQDNSSKAPIDWRVELTSFYTANNLHEKIQSIDAILDAWDGREFDMMEVLHQKYKVVFDDKLRERLSQ